MGTDRPCAHDPSRTSDKCRVEIDRWLTSSEPGSVGLIRKKWNSSATGTPRICRAMFEFGSEPCDVRGYEGMTWLSAGIERMYRNWVELGDMDAAGRLLDRMFGRIPYAIDAKLIVNQSPEATADELIARVERLRAEAMELRAQETLRGAAENVIDVESAIRGGEGIKQVGVINPSPSPVKPEEPT